MTALAAARATLQQSGGVLPTPLSIPVKASQTIYQGGLVCVDSTGYAVPASTATGLVIMGVANATANNASGSNGAIDVSCSCGIFKFANSSAGDAIAQSEVGDICFLVDDQTVAKTDGTGTRSRAGRVMDVDSGGVWVAVNPYGLPTDAATLTGTETLTNKTIVTPTIASFANATHNHTNAAGGGTITDAALSAAVGVTKGGTGLATVAAGDILYASASNTIAALTKGAANKCLRMNAGATAPEWAGAGELDDGATLTFAANDIDFAPVNGCHYDVPTTGAASTVTLDPTGRTRGNWCMFTADGTKNGHTVQYRDKTGPVNLTTALTASKRHTVIAVFDGTNWHCNAYIAP